MYISIYVNIYILHTPTYVADSRAFLPLECSTNSACTKRNTSRHVCIHIYIRVCIYTYIYKHAYIYIHMYTSTAETLRTFLICDTKLLMLHV